MFVVRTSGDRDSTTLRINGTDCTRTTTNSNTTVGFRFSHGTSEPTGSNDDLAGWWGRRTPAESNLPADVNAAEWILWENELSTSQVQSIESALVSKWGSFS